MEGALVSVEELDLYVVEDQQLCRIYEEVVITDRTQKCDFGLLLLVVIVKDASFANDLEVGLEATFLKLGDSDHADFKDLLDYSRYSECRDLYFAPMLHEMVKVVDVADLTWYCHPFCVSRSDLAVVYQGFVGSFAELAVDKVATYHNSCATFTCLAVDCRNVFRVFR
jgi:hypothetical protein